MHEYTLSHVSDAALLRDLVALVQQDRLTTAKVLAHIAEVDARRLYVPAGYPSMHAYCVEELRLSDDAAAKRIQAARAARQFPDLFTALAEGRLHLTAVCQLAPHLTPDNASELVDMASHRRKAEIEEILARRFPGREVPARVRALSAPVRAVPAIPATLLLEHALAHVGPCDDQHAPAHVEEARGEPAPPSAERFLLQLTIEKSTLEKLRYAQSLLSHAVPTGDLAQVLDRAFDTLITQLEKRKLGSRTPRPRRERTSTRKRYVPPQVRRAVWERDQGRCTYVSASGKRCNSRRFLEFDHIDPVARGGKATVEGMRLRCRAHNQYEAERVFGAPFMRQKRQEARLAAAADARARAAANDQTQDVLAGLRSLGCRADQARRAAELSETLHGATLEERMRAALQHLGKGSIQSRRAVLLNGGG